MFTQLQNRALRRATLVTMLGISGLLVNAATVTFTTGGITYKSTDGETVEIQKPASGVTYEGDYVIPATVENDGVTYSVAKMNNSAFKNNTTVTGLDLGATAITSVGRTALGGMTALKTLVLPTGLTSLSSDAMSGDSALEALVIPGGVTKINSNILQDCYALKDLTFAASTEALSITNTMWGSSTLNSLSLENLTINRVLDLESTTLADQPFANIKAIKNVVFADGLTSVPQYMFQNCTGLTTVNIPSTVTSIGSQAFYNTGITSIVIPDGVTTINASTFYNCTSLTSVTLGNATTSIGAMAFYKAAITSINFPETLTSIGAQAFQACSIGGEVTFPSALKSIGDKAFQSNKATAYNIPASVTSIGSSCFYNNTKLQKFTVDAANENYKVSDGGALVSKDGLVLYSYPVASTPTSYTDNAVVELDAYAFCKATKLTEINLPSCLTYGDYSLSNTGITSYSLNGTIGRYVLANNANLVDVTVDSNECPTGVVKGCTALTSYTSLQDVVIVRQDAFNGCSALKDLNLGKILAILEADCFAGCNGLNLIVAANYPAAMAQGVFTEETVMSATVPTALVDTYKNAAGWQYLTIKGDENLAIGGEDMGMPDGLYYAGTDGDLYCYYADGQFDSYDVGGLPHTFQLAQFNHRIYGASAGQKFVYSATGSTDGDGVLFYISKIGGNVFQATVLDNAGGNAYKDPFGLYIYGDTLYVNDRNVCARKIAADAISLPQDYPSWFENNWLYYYGNPWVYGCIKAGFAITQDQDDEGNPEPLYWFAFKYNGEGIFRFKEKHIGSSSAAGPDPGYTPIFSSNGTIMTTFNIDEKNGHLYIYIETANNGKDTQVLGGLYRYNLSDLMSANASDIVNVPRQLIDGAPVYWEGSSTNEHVGISQLTIDENNEYMYWCYRAPSESDIQNVANEAAGHYKWAEDYDATNPRHVTGIKRIKLGEENPEVELVVEGVEGYGVVPVNFAGSIKPNDGKEGVQNVNINEKAAYDRINVAGNSFATTENAKVNVYNANGQLVICNAVVADELTTIDGAGVYVIEAIFTDGAKQVIKMAVK